MKMVIRIIKIAIFLGVLAAFGFLVSRKIDLITADLGRHIVNGYTILHGSNTERQEVLYSNYYSYTEPQRVFVNHHWGSGVLFYWVHQLAGFVGVSVFFVLLCLLTFALYYAWAIQKGGWLVATALAILLMPLMASRAEVRPEVFTYLFSGIYLIALNHAEFNAEKRGNRKLWLLPAVMLVWVNLHIGFIFGFFILGIFGLVRLGQDLRLRIIDKSKPVFSREFIILFKIGLVCLVAALVNPWFIKGVLYPFQIFRNYGYMIVENQSVRFLEKLSVTSTLNFGLYKIALVVAGASMVVASVLWLRRRKAAGVGSIAENAIVVVFGVLGYLGIRHFPSFAFLALPVVAGNLAALKGMRRVSSPNEKTSACRTCLAQPWCTLWLYFALWSVCSVFIIKFRFLNRLWGLGCCRQPKRRESFLSPTTYKGRYLTTMTLAGMPYFIYAIIPKFL